MSKRKAEVSQLEYGGLQMDAEGYLHFREGEYEKAQDWKRWVVGLLNRMREVELKQKEA
jgi:hypothetical protein